MARKITVSLEIKKSSTSNAENVRIAEGTTLEEFKEMWSINDRKSDVFINGEVEEDDYELEAGDRVEVVPRNYNSGIIAA